MEDPKKEADFALEKFKAKPGRTFGLKAVDVWIYPLVTNTGVFVTSVFFTFLTNRGSHFGKAGGKARAFGELMEKRGEWLKGQYMNAGLPAPFANNLKMVTWSFLDGTALAPAIMGFENNRTPLAHWIDKMAGTEPDDMSIYTEEPKQTWKSVLGARALTAGIVAPTAAALNNVNFRMLGQYQNLNHHMFTRPGIALGNQLKENASLVRKIGKENIEEIANCTFFEGFYTSVCTTGQYYISRWLASDNENKVPDTTVQEAQQPAPLKEKSLATAV